VAGEISTESAANDALADVAAGLRRLTELLLRVDDDDPAMAVVVEALDRISDMRDPQDVDRRSTADWCADNLVSGGRNALAPPLQVDVSADGTAISSGLLGLPHQGPKGMVHGGVSALLLEHLLEMAGSVVAEDAVIAELSVRYQRPLPVYEQVVITCGPAAVVEQTLRAHGEIEVGGDVAVSADAVFVVSPNEGTERSCADEYLDI
jgi:hypothetical protein